MTDRDTVYQAIDEERAYQDNLWGPTGSAGNHGILSFLSYIYDYTKEALHDQCRLVDDVALDKGRHSLRKIAALAVAALEQNGVVRRGYTVPEGEDLTRHGINPGG